MLFEAYSRSLFTLYVILLQPACYSAIIRLIFSMPLFFAFLMLIVSPRLSRKLRHTSLLGYIFFLPVETIVLRARYSSGRSAVTHCLLFQLIARPNVRSLCKFTYRPSGFDTQWTLYRSARGCPLRFGCLPRSPGSYELPARRCRNLRSYGKLSLS